MRYDAAGVIVLLAIAAYLLFFNKSQGTSLSTTLPQGTQSLSILKQQRSSDLAQARSMCTSQFKGSWVDTSNSVGCYNMQGFSTSFCGLSQIQNVIKSCQSIGGTAVCSSTQASCTV